MSFVLSHHANVNATMPLPDLIIFCHVPPWRGEKKGPPALVFVLISFVKFFHRSWCFNTNIFQLVISQYFRVVTPLVHQFTDLRHGYDLRFMGTTIYWDFHSLICDIGDRSTTGPLIFDITDMRDHQLPIHPIDMPDH